jgi:23S rRNA maturation mini-RNase III
MSGNPNGQKQSVLKTILYAPTNLLAFISDKLYSVYLSYLSTDKLLELKNELQEEIDAIALAEQKQEEQIIQEMYDELSEFYSEEEVEEMIENYLTEKENGN